MTRISVQPIGHTKALNLSLDGPDMLLTDDVENVAILSTECDARGVIGCSALRGYTLPGSRLFGGASVAGIGRSRNLRFSLAAICAFFSRQGSLAPALEQAAKLASAATSRVNPNFRIESR
jgi:hypothetical protein